jgi:predicted nucleic acid-binding protein
VFPVPLHHGEREAILLAEALRSDVLLIDAQMGPTIALSPNLPLSGTLGVLERADTLGFVNDFLQILKNLKTSGFFVAEVLEQELLQRHRARRLDQMINPSTPAWFCILQIEVRQNAILTEACTRASCRRTW